MSVEDSLTHSILSWPFLVKTLSQANFSLSRSVPSRCTINHLEGPELLHGPTDVSDGFNNVLSPDQGDPAST